MNSLHKLSVLVLSLAITTGCFDPHGRFEEFGDRLIDAGPTAPTPDAAPLEELPDVTGRFLIGLSTTVAPDLPLRFVFANELTMGPDGTATLTTRIQPLAVADGMPVGDEIVIETPVNSAGEFQVVLSPVNVPGAANPITGSPIEANVTLAGRILSEDRYCGTVPAGTVLKPVMLDVSGSTWSGFRIADDMIGGNLPPVEKECPTNLPEDGDDQGEDMQRAGAEVTR